ncbi:MULTISPECIES: DUF4270 domain-containing protein [Flavobacterium]|uniref:DUF4270 domain-containing protein n=1 Tax=Flavobacterium hankyongi TaxID=1176532 RepID=A0ABP8ZQA2_9FLAO|nr:DUF4270 domain-containing protein [Flavobacterium sp. N1846]
MINNQFLKGLAIAFMALFVVSCDKDYNSIGSDIVGNEHFTFGDGELFGVRAYSQKTGAIQTNNLPLNQLGVLNSPTFGLTKAHFVTQLEMVTANPEFDASAAIDSVVLTVPYFSKKVETEASGRSIYKLDSVYGWSISNKMDLRVYENGYYLKEFDPNNNFGVQKYYSDEKALFSSNKIGTTTPNNPNMDNRLNDWIDPNPKDPTRLNDDKRENLLFYPNEREYVKYKVNESFVQTTEIESRNSPRLRMKLNEKHFKDKIINAPAGKLVNNSVFKEYFRGLYFEIEGSSGALMTLNFKQGDVTIYYKQNKSATSTDKVMKEFRFNLLGNTVNVHENTFDAGYVSALNAPIDPVEGSSSLYIKGGEGSGAFISILNDQEKAKLKGNIINGAFLTFSIDRSKMGTSTEPNRVSLYNADSNIPLYDFYFDGTTNASDPKTNKYVYGGMIEKEAVGSDKKGVRYKINITEHVNNVVNKDSTNVKLGLIVNENINYVGNSFIRTSFNTPNPDNKKVDRFPSNSVMSPLGTVLYGTHSSVPVDKRVQFKVYYTKPN